MKKVVIVFIGDSFVNGTGDTEFLGWSGRVCQKLQQYNNIELTYYNIGVRGETSSDILKRWEQEAFQRFEDGSQNIAIFSFGVNDCLVLDQKQKIDLLLSEQNLKNILSTAKIKYNDVLFIMPPPIEDDEINQRIKTLIKIYTKVCINLNVKFIDAFEYLMSNKIWKKEIKENDYAHPRK